MPTPPARKQLLAYGFLNRSRQRPGEAISSEALLNTSKPSSTDDPEWQYWELVTCRQGTGDTRSSSQRAISLSATESLSYKAPAFSKPKATSVWAGQSRAEQNRTRLPGTPQHTRGSRLPCGAEPAQHSHTRPLLTLVPVWQDTAAATPGPLLALVCVLAPVQARRATDTSSCLPDGDTGSAEILHLISSAAPLAPPRRQQGLTHNRALNRTLVPEQRM